MKKFLIAISLSALALSGCSTKQALDEKKDNAQTQESSNSSQLSSTQNSSALSLDPMKQLDGCIQKDLRYAQGKYPNDKVEIYKKEFQRVFVNPAGGELGEYGVDIGYECPFGDKKLVTFYYVAKGPETFFGNYSRAKYTVFAFLNDQDKIVNSVTTSCPLVDDVGPAYMLATKDDQLLAGCFTGGAGGQSIFDFLIIDLKAFSSRLVYRESYLQQHPEDKTITDKTESIPIEFKERINFAMDFWKN